MVRLRLGLVHRMVYARTRQTSCVSKGARTGGACSRDLLGDAQAALSGVGRSTHTRLPICRREHRGGLWAFITTRVRAISTVGDGVMRRSGAAPDFRAIGKQFALKCSRNWTVRTAKGGECWQVCCESSEMNSATMMRRHRSPRCKLAANARRLNQTTAARLARLVVLMFRLPSVLRPLGCSLFFGCLAAACSSAVLAPVCSSAFRLQHPFGHSDVRLQLTFNKPASQPTRHPRSVPLHPRPHPIRKHHLHLASVCHEHIARIAHERHNLSSPRIAHDRHGILLLVPRKPRA